MGVCDEESRLAVLVGFGERLEFGDVVLCYDIEGEICGLLAFVNNDLGSLTVDE